jgi:Sulfotransferase family
MREEMTNNIKYIMSFLITVLFMPLPEACWASKNEQIQDLIYEQSVNDFSCSPGGTKIGTQAAGENFYHRDTSCQEPDDPKEDLKYKKWHKKLRKVLNYHPANLSEKFMQAIHNFKHILQLPQEPPEDDSIIPIFVMGPPRSGTTLMGAYLGSCPRVYNFIEYTGFYLSLEIGPECQSKVEAPYKEHYYPSLFKHAKKFCVKQARAQNCIAYVDSNPFNLLIIKKLQQKISPAIFIIMLRNYKGVIPSLERSFKDDRLWAGETDQARAALYLKFYRCLDDVDPARAIYLDYDQLCSHPESTLKEFEKAFHSKLNQVCGAHIPEWKFNREVFCQAHATSSKNTTSEKRCIGKRTLEGGIKLEPIEPYNEEEWPPEREKALQPLVEQYDRILKRRKLNPKALPPEKYRPAFPDGCDPATINLSQELFTLDSMPTFPEGCELGKRKLTQELLTVEDMPTFPEGVEPTKFKKVKSFVNPLPEA